MLTTDSVSTNKSASPINIYIPYKAPLPDSPDGELCAFLVMVMEEIQKIVVVFMDDMVL